MKWIYLCEIVYEIKSDIVNFFQRRKSREKDYEIWKWKSYTELLVKWKRLWEHDKSIVTYIKNSGCKKIAVYGCGSIGKLCCDELQRDGDITVVQMLDRVVRGEYNAIPVVSPEDINSCIDAVIITPICAYYEVAECLVGRTKAKLISLEDIIDVLSETG